jgi:hypothetical protein
MMCVFLIPMKRDMKDDDPLSLFLLQTQQKATKLREELIDPNIE